MQHRVRQVAVVDAAFVLELPDVVGEHDVKRVDAGEALLEVLAVPLDAGAERPEVHAVRADADGPAPAAGAEGHDLVERIEQHRPLRGLDEPLELRPIRSEIRLSQPGTQIGERFSFSAALASIPSKPARI